MPKDYSHLFKEIKIGSLNITNRIVMPAMATKFAAYGGSVTAKMINYYEKRAEGGVGLIIVENAAVLFSGRSSNYSLGIYDDSLLPGLQKLTNAVHNAGAKVALQLAHAGAGASSNVTNIQPVAPSAVPRFHGETPLEISPKQIALIIEAFAAAADRAVRAGFDAVEIHMAHGYLIDQFLSPISNRRIDGYGGDIKGRARFALEILNRIVAQLGQNYPVICRITGDQFQMGGFELNDSRMLAKMLEQKGASALHVTGGSIETVYYSAPPLAIPAGCLLPLAEEIKKSVGIPVIAVGKIRGPEEAERVLSDHQADLVAMGRALIADPELPRKSKRGETRCIRPCISCNNPQCHGRLYQDLGIGCTVNATVGRERQTSISKTAEPKKILVAGAGPAGLEAARVSALRGHKVVICEKRDRIGGQLFLASLPPHKSELTKLLDYYNEQIKLLKIRLLTNCELDSELLSSQKPDKVLVATGSRSLLPPIDGAKEYTTSALEALREKVSVGKNIVIIGGGDIGCETAEFVAQKGNRVTVLEMTNLFARNYIWWAKKLLMDRLAELKVNLVTSAKVVRIKKHRVDYVRGGYLETVEPVDTILLATGLISDRAVVSVLENANTEYKVIGDCNTPRDVSWAVREGFEAAFLL